MTWKHGPQALLSVIPDCLGSGLLLHTLDTYNDTRLLTCQSATQHAHHQIGGLRHARMHAGPDAGTPGQPKAEAPKPPAPKLEAPKIEAPKVEAPKIEAPKLEVPKHPKVEAPKLEAPKPPSIPTPQAPALPQQPGQLLIGAHPCMFAEICPDQ